MPRHSQIDVARIQIDRAIRLFLDTKDFISAATLAGAADSLLGEMLGAQNAANSLSVSARIVSVLSSGAISEKELIKGDNEVRNWLKHHRPYDLEFEPEDAASFLIDRAQHNYFLVTNEQTDLMKRYDEYFGHDPYA